MQPPWLRFPHLEGNLFCLPGCVLSGPHYRKRFCNALYKPLRPSSGREAILFIARTKYPAWIRCPDCDEFYCTIHRCHTSESGCTCRPVEEWRLDPYVTGGYRLTTAQTISPHENRHHPSRTR